MTKVRTIAAAVDRIAKKSPDHVALIYPPSLTKPLTAAADDCTTTKSYLDLSLQSRSLSSWLQRYGYQQGDILMSDLPSTHENLILQIACNRIGVGYGTVPDLESMAKFPRVKGAVSASAKGFLADTNLPLPYLSEEFMVDLIETKTPTETEESGGNEQLDLDDSPDSDDDDDEKSTAAEKSLEHGFFDSPDDPGTNQQFLENGQSLIDGLNMSEYDVVCIAASMNGYFGLSGACGAFLTGATICFPTELTSQKNTPVEDGILAASSDPLFDVLESTDSTLLLIDLPTFETVPEPPTRDIRLRGGICKVGSGLNNFTIRSETLLFGSVDLKTM